MKHVHSKNIYKWIKRVCHYGPESKRQSIEKKLIDSLVKEKSGAQQSVKKVMLTVFWDMNRLDFLEVGATANSVSYS